MTTTLFRNGTIRTNVEASSATWLLVDGDGIAETGHSDGAPDADRIVDLQGGALVPGFCDAHAHLPATGIYASGMDFRGVRKVDEILDAFRTQGAGGGSVLFGGNFEDPLDRSMSRHDLDRAVGERPAMLTRADMHSCIVSSALLSQLDLSDPEGVDLDEGGEPTGYLREKAARGAYNWFENNLPREEQIEAIRAAARLAYSKGVTSVHEMFVVEWRGWDSFDVFTEAMEPLALIVRPYLATTEVERVRALGYRSIGGDWFLDGSFGSHTAWMKEPFTSKPPPGSPERGVSYRRDEEVRDFFFEAQSAGMQVGVHAIGDAAIDQAVSAWEKVAAKVGAGAVRSLGHRLEHFECSVDDLIARSAALGLRISGQPAFDAFWGGEDGLYSERIGWDRARHMNRCRSWLDAGLWVGAGSDSTVTPLDPFLQMSSLRSHHVEEERLTGQEALFLHTYGAHGLSMQDPDRGKLEAGSVADLAWLDRDPVTTDPEELTKTEVLGTWIGGDRVWPLEEAEAS